MEPLKSLQPWEKDVRLPRNIIPLHYNLFLHPEIQNATFSGKVEIELNVTSPAIFLAVHTKALDITETKLAKGENEIPIRDAFYSSGNHFWVILFAEGSKLEPGTAKLTLSFNGSLTGKIVGFYRSTYKTASGTNRFVDV